MVSEAGGFQLHLATRKDNTSGYKAVSQLPRFFTRWLATNTETSSVTGWIQRTMRTLPRTKARTPGNPNQGPGTPANFLESKAARRAAKIDLMLVTELQSRGSFGVCTKLADLVTWHSSAAHGGGSCTMRSTKAASYTSIVTVRGSSETVGALHRRM